MRLLYRLVLILTVPLCMFSCSKCSVDGTSLLKKNAADETLRITLMTYNVENLFDDVDNGTEYREYDPGEGDWTIDLFHAKMLQIAEVIGTAVPKGPDIVALQEIENQHALEVLRTEGVKNLGYRYSALVEAPEAAVNTAVLSRFPLKAVRSHALHMQESEGLRNILEVAIEINGKVLFVLSNHWKSKSGGAEETEPLRIAAAKLVERRVQTLRELNPAADVVVCGDLNENHNEAARIEEAYPTALVVVNQSEAVVGGTAAGGLAITGNRDLMVEILGNEAARSDAAGSGVLLYSPWFEAVSGDGMQGSYMYKNSWETIDHFLLSAGLFDTVGFSYAEFDVICRDYMIHESGAPLRWNSEMLSGYSDHFPLVLTLELR